MRRVLALAVLLAGCDSSDSLVCQPGRQAGCMCPGGAQGAQACNSSGTGFTACICPDGGVSPQDSSIPDSEASVSLDGSWDGDGGGLGGHAGETGAPESAAGGSYQDVQAEDSAALVEAGDTETGAGGSGGTAGEGGYGGGGSGGTGGVGGAPVGGSAGASCELDAGFDWSIKKQVSGGSFLRSFDGIAFTDSSNPATVSTFELDLYEVTVGRFRSFVEAGKGLQTSAPSEGQGAVYSSVGGWQSDWTASLPLLKNDLTNGLKCDPDFQTWTDLPGNNECRPINCVSWFEALAFCIWDGGRLPTEAEWNYAAAGGSEQRPYPWGTAQPSGHASFGCTGDGVAGCTLSDLRAVGSFTSGVGKWGHHDLAGNVSEWVLDGYGAYTKPCSDCVRTDGSDRSCRGGSFNSQATDLYASMRAHRPPTFGSSGTGFRCMRESALADQ